VKGEDNPIPKQVIRELIQAAMSVREQAAAHYSGFKVGAALRDVKGRIWTGCNVESSSYGLSCCAERVALFKAITEGIREFDRIAIVADGPALVSPCGACRQVLHDFAPKLVVHMYNPVTGAESEALLSNLFPAPFDSGNLKETEG